MRKHPRLITGLAVAGLLLLFLVPTALAKPSIQSHPDIPCEKAPKNPHCQTTETTVTTTRTTQTSTVSYPPGGGTVTRTTRTTTTGTTVITSGEFTPCKDGTPPPCGQGRGEGHNKSADLGSSSGIPAGAVFAALGVLTLGYLGIHRRRALKLDK